MDNNIKKPYKLSRNRSGDRSIVSLVMKDYNISDTIASIDINSNDEIKFNNFSKDLCKLLDQYQYKYINPIVKDGNKIIIVLRDKEEEKYNA